ncbi:hypothetical protein ALC56_05724 [Trachymyrmex septentrionalis]|uniref:Uncharacterized protein n=1 Tax=Trachymyrmex septentrionalis TaxID=34720 RepID=A0A195FHX1_9HYME|nr:PREDICTED: uncharacterized protein LOC108748021 [Trachymyrmex septentrionalis]KYN39956.1 hypothetical protein ALC56_05724 [Trachymyrmex septentrionalis]
MNKFLTLVLLATYTAAGPTDVQPSQNLNCVEYDNAFFSCMFVKTIGVLNRATRSSNIEIIDGVTFVRDTPMERHSRNLEMNEKKIMNELPYDSTDRVIKLLNMLYDSTVSFTKSHSLKFDMPEGSISRALTEGRAKIKKVFLPFIAAAGLKLFAFAPLLLFGLGLLTVKALIFGKLALLATGYVVLQKLFSGSSVGSFFNKNPGPPLYDYGAGNWPAGSQQQGYYRNFNADSKMDAQNLAYPAHVPNAVPNN